MEWYSIDQMATRAGLHRQTVYNKIKEAAESGSEYVRKERNQWRVQDPLFADYLKEQAVQDVDYETVSEGTVRSINDQSSYDLLKAVIEDYQKRIDHLEAELKEERRARLKIIEGGEAGTAKKKQRKEGDLDPLAWIAICVLVFTVVGVLVVSFG